ncbi:hypothetical protein TELCIR_08163 [Teladorsagia circumcincta]|uniref:Uncharacterized protein n=1 Tax=Teladorsagia circumcincta TaxID=45464 RepID=A0A2G9UIC8_TELCI|nr:hypothetical protein TELCIR_08163 [Teladorsagia circumcincta]
MTARAPPGDAVKNPTIMGNKKKKQEKQESSSDSSDSSDSSGDDEVEAKAAADESSDESSSSSSSSSSDDDKQKKKKKSSKKGKEKFEQWCQRANGNRQKEGRMGRRAGRHAGEVGRETNTVGQYKGRWMQKQTVLWTDNTGESRRMVSRVPTGRQRWRQGGKQDRMGGCREKRRVREGGIANSEKREAKEAESINGIKKWRNSQNKGHAVEQTETEI